MDEVLARYIFEPLGMKDTGFTVPPEKFDRFPTCYWKHIQTGELAVFDPSGAESFFATMPGFPDARGGLVSTADDYLAFAQMLLNQGRVGNTEVLSAKSAAAMMTDHIPSDVKARSPFSTGFWEKRGWGYQVSIMEKQVPGGPRGVGWDGGYGTCAYWDPRTGVTAIFLSQRLMESPNHPEIFRKFFDNAYPAAGV